MRRIFGGRDSDHPRKRGRGFAGAVLLSAGLALGGCAVKAPVQPVQRPRVEQKSSRLTTPKLNCVTIVPAKNERVSMLWAKKGTCEVRTGDELIRIEFLFEKAGYFKYSVGKIDDRGVEIIMEMGVFMSEYESNRAMPWRINFGESKGIGVGVSPGGTPKSDNILTIKAERGTKPGSAILTIKGVR